MRQIPILYPQIYIFRISLKNNWRSLLLHILFYDIMVMLSNRYPATGGGDLHGNCNLFSCLLHGWCSLPLHHQMVRRRQVGQHWPGGFLSTINKQEEAPSIRSTEGFTLFCPHGLAISFAYGNYSICFSWLQYAKTVADSVIWGRISYRIGLFFQSVCN